MSDAGFLGTLHYSPLVPLLHGRGANWYTQFGEDGLIEAVFEKIGTRNSWCFEVGAADGVYFSNTLRLREHDWDAVLIEGSEEFDQLLKFQTDRVRCVREYATDMDEILSRFGAPEDLDFGCIDVDGQDYWLWHDMQLYRPRVMLVEFAWASDADIPPRGATDRRQAGESAIRELGASKGYVPVARTHVNLLFVREDAWASN